MKLVSTASNYQILKQILELKYQDIIPSTFLSKKNKTKNHLQKHSFFAPRCRLPFLAVKPLLGLHRQPGMSFSMLTQLNVIVIYVVAYNLYTLVHKVIVWQPDCFLSSAKEANKLESVTLGWVLQHNILTMQYCYTSELQAVISASFQN